MLQKTLKGLRTEHTKLVSSSTSSSSTLERTKAELDGVQASHTELRKKYAELERSNEDLRRQLEKEHTTESRDGEELETLRKRKVELEVEIAQLQETAESREEKFKTKLQRFKASIQEHSVRRRRHARILRRDSGFCRTRTRLLRMSLRR